MATNARAVPIHATASYDVNAAEHPAGVTADVVRRSRRIEDVDALEHDVDRSLRAAVGL